MAFEIEDGVLRRYTGTDEEVRVPQGVRVIFDNAFSENRHVRRVVLPAGLETVGSWAFNRCQLLEEAVLPDGLLRIGRSAFRSCIRLRGVRLPASLTALGGKAFEFCKNIEHADIPAGIRAIDDKTFSNCSGLRVLTVPDGVARIGGWAFEGCVSLRAVRIPDSVQSLGEGAFQDCAALAEVQVGAGVRALGADAFTGTPWLEDAGDDFFIVNGSLLRYNGGARWVAVPPGVSTICAGVFECVPKMEGAVLPESIREIGEGAFEGCPALRRAELPKGITSLGAGAFELCRRLEAVSVRGMVEPAELAGDAWAAHRKLFGESCGVLTVRLPPACGVTFRTVFRADESGIHASFGAYAAAFRKAQDINGKVWMALCRLLSPYRPESGETAVYRAFLTAHAEDAMRLFLAQNDLLSVRTLGELSILTEEALPRLTQMATEAQNAEAAAYLLAYKREHFGFHAPTFDL